MRNGLEKVFCNSSAYAFVIDSEMGALLATRGMEQQQNILLFIHRHFLECLRGDHRNVLVSNCTYRMVSTREIVRLCSLWDINVSK